MGRVVSVGDGIATIYGLENVQAGEMVEFEGGLKGMALNLETDSVGVVIFGSDTTIKEGSSVQAYRLPSWMCPSAPNCSVAWSMRSATRSTAKARSTPNNVQPRGSTKAPGIVYRKSVHEPVQTGIKSIDALIPIGRGQRELIIGDRQTGKTAIAIDTILNQKAAHDAGDKTRNSCSVSMWPSARSVRPWRKW